MRKNFLRNLVTVVGSNLIAVVLGICISLILPILMGDVEAYGRWQLYYFYSGFYGLLLFGLNDGMNLLYAGQKYSALDRKKFSAFFAFLCVLMLFVSIFLVAAAILFLEDQTQKIIALSTIASFTFLNITGFVLHIHQITLRFKDYARINVLEKTLFVATFIPIYLINEKAYMIFIAASLTARAATTVYGLYTVSDLLQIKFINFQNLHVNIKYIFQNLRVGFPLTISTVLAMFIVTSPRIIVERTLSVYDFGLFSLAFAILSIIVIMISALSTVLYPSLKTRAKHTYHAYNARIRYVITILCGLAFAIAFAIPKFIELFLPDYIEVIPYIFILVAWVMYQSLGGMLNDVFFRLARLQKSLLVINVIGLAIIMLAQYTVLNITGDIKTTVAIGLLVLAIWFHMGDIYLYKKNHWQITVHNFIDIPIVLGFCVITALNSSLLGLLAYSALLLIVLVVSRDKLRDVYLLYKSKRISHDITIPRSIS